MASITLEPGGQFELSGAPLEHLHQTCAETGSHLSQLRDVAGAMGIAFLGARLFAALVARRNADHAEGRYKIMRDYMPKVGRLGRQMMFRSCTVQTNLDFGSEADMVKKFRVGIALQPIATALFAASPFAEGRTNGFLSYRGHIWTDTDPDRTGMLPFVFEDGMGFERYADYALDVPMYFVYRDGKYIDARAKASANSWRANCRRLPGELPTAERLGRSPHHDLPGSALEDVPGNARRGFRPMVAPVRAAGVLGRHLLRRRRARSGVVAGEELDGGRSREPAPRGAGAWA